MSAVKAKQLKPTVETISLKALADLSGYSERQIYRLVESGALPALNDGIHFNRDEVLAALITYLRNQLDEELGQLKKEKIRRETELKDEQIAKAKLERKIAEGEYVSEKEVAGKAIGIFEQTKSALTFSFVDRAPSINDGLPAQQQRTNNKQLLNDALRGLADWAGKQAKG